MNPKTLDFLEKLQKTVEGGAVQPQEFVSAIKAILKLFKDLKQELNGAFTSLSNEFKKGMEKQSEAVNDIKKSHEDEMRSLAAKLSVDNKNTRQLISQEVKRIEGMMPEMPDMEAHGREMMARLSEIEAKIPTINELTTADEVQDLIQEELEELRAELKRIESKPILARQGFLGGFRRVYQPYLDRFSDETNGSTKTFYLSREPLKTDTIKVWGTDFPIILDPTTDFTVSGKTLTLTSAVPAPSSGATLIVEYFA